MMRMAFELGVQKSEKFSLYDQMRNTPQKHCIFCGGKPTTKEHIWSGWMHSYLPVESDARNEVHQIRRQAKSPDPLPAVSQSRPGPVRTKKIRAVCAACNNGWMSRLESAVKPILIPLIRGDAGVLDEDAQTLLARWISTKAIVTEYSRDNERVTLLVDRHALRTNHTIPPYFSIRIGRNGSSWRTLYYRHSTTISLDRAETAPPMDGVERNVEQITMLFDTLAVQVLAIQVPGYPIAHRIVPQIGVQLWPIQTGTLDFGKSELIRDAALVASTHSLDAFLQANQRGWRPLPNER